MIIDTGCARQGNGGIEQDFSNCTAVGRNPAIDSIRATRYHLQIGSETSKGTTRIHFPLDNVCLSLDIHIVEADDAILLSVVNMDQLGVYLDNFLDYRVLK